MIDQPTRDRVQEAAQLLADARRTGIKLPELPERCRSQSVAEAEDVQDAVAAALGERIGG